MLQIYTNYQNLKQFKAGEQEPDEMVFSFGLGLPMWSDIQIKLMSETYMSESTLLRFGFNTAFIVKNKLVVNKQSVSPEKVGKDS